MRALGVGLHSVAPAWSPLRLSPRAWTRPAGYSPSTGAWTNLGTGGNGSQGTSSKRPTAGVLTTGAPALVFDGVDDCVVLPSACRPSSPSYTQVVVVQPAATSSYPYIIGSNPADTGFALLAINGNTLSLQPFIIGNVNAFALVSGHDLSVGTPYVVTVTYDGTTQRVYLGQTLVRSATGAVASASSSSVVVGAQNTGGSYSWPGRIADVFMADGVPDATTRQRLIAYIAAANGGISV